MKPENRATGLSVVVGSALMVGLFLLVGVSGIFERMRMMEQPSIQPMEPSEHFEDRQSARPLPEGTVARGYGPDQITSVRPVDSKSGRPPELAASPDEDVDGPGPYPVPVTREFIERGRDQFETYCSPCHGSDGHGNGIIVQRGMVSPPSFHIDRLRQQSPKYFYDAATNGFGRMFSYASRVAPRDRWAIAAYIEALQLSQQAPVDRLEAEDRQQLQDTSP